MPRRPGHIKGLPRANMSRSECHRGTCPASRDLPQ
ncbi:hypothetical protein CGLO_14237 [Colletotrichum gloeosporioides Cg-14]|uniref:Uncharacterized protein n=1 Tax=Colletotrichum gloeosporioides (strain Cg-14) TaxID=1237896 RepID=T0LE71_COLGC|nr:hypothetical protein CGLO_14237 [Colletotrichum gloeosporioides Cg-14]